MTYTLRIPAVTETSSEPLAQARVILAEDDPGLRALIADALRSRGHSVDEVGDGEALVRRVLTTTLLDDAPDVIVTDLGMPRGGGLGALSRLRTMGMHVPVIVMTGVVDRDVRAALAALDVKLLLEKPVDVDHLVRALGSVLG